MKGNHNKFLTIFFLMFSSWEISAGIIFHELGKDHYRWNISIPKKQLVIDKKGKDIYLKTLNKNLFEQLKKSLGPKMSKNKYISAISSISGNQISSLKITLKDDYVETFSFFRERDKNHVIDFWIDSDSVQTKKSAVIEKTKITRPKKEVKPVLSRVKKSKAKKIKKATKTKSPYRDFRYGAAFVWDYDPVSPRIKSTIDLKIKTPEYFFPIENRDYEKNEEESHLQLAINLYRKKKFGLMYKALKLYSEKFPTKNVDLVEYLKVNAILREYIDNKDESTLKTAITMLDNILQSTDNYLLRRSIYKCLTSFYIDNNENVQLLAIGKKFYVDSKENHDYEESVYAAEIILNSLTKLRQHEKVDELIKDKTIVKLIPKQIILSYQVYVYMLKGKADQVIKLYEKNKKGMIGSVHHSILYNVAESYFRKAEYEKAIKVYDRYLKEYSYEVKSSEARLRIALSYDLLNKDFKKIKALYKYAINRSQNPQISYEARIRYVALRNLRQIKVNDSDKEIRVFLEQRNKEQVSDQLKKLLWLVRMRLFVVDEKYSEALTYLNAIPLNKLPKTSRRTFKADGAEVIYGILMNKYQALDYSRVVQGWEVYKDSYINKVALDPYINFIVGKSYLNMELYDGLEGVLSNIDKILETPVKTFPLWVSRENKINAKEMVAELKILRNIKLGNYSVARKHSEELKNKFYQNRAYYYMAIIDYEEKKYSNSTKNFEVYLTNKESKGVVDTREIAQILDKYTDAIYKSGDISKFEKVSSAILEDTKSVGKESEYFTQVKERVRYLLLEIRAGKSTAKDSLLLQKEIVDFKKDFPETNYIGRVDYLLGMALMKNKNNKGALDVFNNLLKDTKTPEHMKDMVRAELSLLKIKNKTL